MSRLEVDVKSIQKLIRSRVTKAQKTLTDFEGQAEKVVKEWVNKGLKSQTEGRKQVEKLVQDVRETVESSDLIKNFRKTNVYHLALQAKDELEKRVADTQEKVFEFLNVPTKEDLDRLSKKVDEIGRKLKSNGRARK
ncbi:MAG: hypothetical protein A2Z91_00225 [Deltaproteobacteria bacterium GWA2_38_16]|nr:MAG: hypothetical protein A2Z91_00225 [Deltaproteobacteria bacterium GWA2_38_16]OGQ03531.1 MAG: hypothetical protein A3D19_01630 [Deltaproteobacteria bacterium RIFCSPHIGHO2_02_FULL_38_15]OGQ34610.1 MAG: hypothetical protein A3A72_07210 [Deltaproteobacteria bacterium RIFCSPLOWO2_01_FULL_38_9]OGQ59496.1 MAG: hypothetical protein A3G92_02670 [Deltaproteobacteria bacterium RIFCSPLOWO2_12_FULL_38_8]HBQ21230.1 hypothetical protein [Deltaproteobacteria bacterium]